MNREILMNSDCLSYGRIIFKTRLSEEEERKITRHNNIYDANCLD